MNVTRGLLRAWIIITVVWVVATALFLYWEVPTMIANGKWAYVHHLRKDIDLNKTDWSKPYYENMLSPSAEKLTVHFHPVEFQYSNQWDQLAREGKMIIHEMPDKSRVYLPADMSKKDQEYVVTAFFDQQWWRYLTGAGPYIVLAFITPPAILFVIGWALIWIGRGFIGSSKTSSFS